VKAVVLVGGEGTRLRPLTETIPKPLLPLVDRPFLHQVLDHLGAHGVHEVILSSPYLERTFEPFLAERHGDPRVTWITESEPLGTAGAIVNALEHVGEESFLVLNGDILTDLDLSALVAFHRERAAVGTIALTPVRDARPYGLVERDPDGRVVEFREKPAELVPGEINAGTYVLEPDALDAWERGRAISIEREVFPALIERGAPMFASVSDAYWMDLGTPERYLQAHFDVLDGKLKGRSFPAPFVAEDALVAETADIERHAVVGHMCRVGEGVSVIRSVLHAGVALGDRSRVEGSILGAGASVGAGAVLTGSVLAEGARIPDGAHVEGARVAPGETTGEPSPA
jgi:mannose-1-phosphate guanylyltransferase